MVATRKGFAALLVGVALGAGTAIAAPGTASAATSPDTVGLAITPTTATVGETVTVMATLTNNTDTTVAASLGIENPQYASEKITGVSEHACNTRNLQKLIYCGNTMLLPGATASITVTLVPTATGTDNFTVYGSITNTNDTYVYGALTVS